MAYVIWKKQLYLLQQIFVSNCSVFSVTIKTYNLTSVPMEWFSLSKHRTYQWTLALLTFRWRKKNMFLIQSVPPFPSIQAANDRSSSLTSLSDFTYSVMRTVIHTHTFLTFTKLWLPYVTCFSYYNGRNAYQNKRTHLPVTVYLHDFVFFFFLRKVFLWLNQSML